MSWYDAEKCDAYAAHLRTTVDWRAGSVVQWPNWSDERTTLHQVAAEFGFLLRVRKGKAVLVSQEKGR